MLKPGAKGQRRADQDMLDALTAMRESGQIPWEWIVDETRSLDDFTPRYETRTYRFANLRGVDIIFFNWGSAVMSHPVLVMTASALPFRLSHPTA